MAMPDGLGMMSKQVIMSPRIIPVMIAPEATRRTRGELNLSK